MHELYLWNCIWIMSCNSASTSKTFLAPGPWNYSTVFPENVDHHCFIIVYLTKMVWSESFSLFLAIFGARGSRVYTLLWKKSDFYLDSQAERLNWNRFLFNVYKTYTGSKEFSFNSFFPSLLLEKWFLEKKESIFVL